ncbi:hypothetical protein GCM10022405_07340 [Gibbsiella dentisursi]|uniref:Uncharacterized protein n=2 Tax=Gibbsiella dentisursi TaxID=796890 RepID=A0ABP7KP96_9GAMM
MVGSNTKDISERDHTSDNGYTITKNLLPFKTKNKTHNHMKNIKINGENNTSPQNTKCIQDKTSKKPFTKCNRFQY